MFGVWKRGPAREIKLVIISVYIYIYVFITVRLNEFTKGHSKNRKVKNKDWLLGYSNIRKLVTREETAIRKDSRKPS